MQSLGCFYFKHHKGFEVVVNARVAELVDALDLGSSGATCESSSLSSRTISNRPEVRLFLFSESLKFKV